MVSVEQLYGRQLVAEKIEPVLLDEAGLIKRPAIIVKGREIICQRCGQKSKCREVALPKHRYFCPKCFQLGRVTSHQFLWSLPEPNQFTDVVKEPLTWQGNLTDAQFACSQEVKRVFEKGESHLLWAVTGAGKTEMLFPGIEWALANGLRVAIASPRVDVCLELAPRLQRAFERTPQIVLYGDMPGVYQYRQLTICTTHQLLRFYHAFDVLVIDEVDAFPFASDPGLLFAAQQAKKPHGALLYLTATPSQTLLKQARNDQLKISYLPARYHGAPLPEIKVTVTRSWRGALGKHRFPSAISACLKKLVRKQRHFLLFIPHVADISAVSIALKQLLPDQTFLAVHAADDERHEKVQQMRDRQLDFLVTTTILERGVTFPDIDVVVLGADDDVYSTAALVQIAGRVGRSVSAPTGLVQFFADGRTGHIREAQRQIKFVNRKARTAGLISEGAK